MLQVKKNKPKTSEFTMCELNLLGLERRDGSPHDVYMVLATVNRVLFLPPFLVKQ